MDDLRLRSLASRDADAVHDSVAGYLKDVWTSLRVIVKEDSDGHTATTQSAVRLAVTQLDGSVKMVEFPELSTAPVHFPNGGGFSHTHPVKKDDEGIATITSRDFENWHKQGGVQDPIDQTRSHHLANHNYHPGGRSDPRKLDPAPSTSSQQNRSDDGNHVVDVAHAGVTHSSTQKVLQNVGGANGSGTMHLPDKILKNAKKVLINCLKAENFPDPGSSFANKKLIATKPVGAMSDPTKAISGIMSQVMSGGLGSVMKNPLASAGGSLASTITAAVTQVTTSIAGGGAGIVSALTGSGGLSSALGGLMGGASALSGASAPTTGQYGLSDLLNHATSLTQFFGNDVPPAVALPLVTAPLQSERLATIEKQLKGVINAAILGDMTPTAAEASIRGLAAQLSAIMPAANDAIAKLQAAIPDMMLAQAAASAMISLDPNEAGVGGALAGSALATLAAAMNQLFTPTAADSAAILSFPDQGAEQAGAMGGFAA